MASSASAGRMASAVLDPRRWQALALLCGTFFMVLLDGTITIVALPSIGAGLRFSEQGLQWVLSAYALAFGGLLLLGGRAAAFPRVPGTRPFTSAPGGGRERRRPRARPMRTIPSATFQGRFQLPRHDPAGGSSGWSVVHTPRHPETRRARTAQFAPRAVYIPGGGTRWRGGKERRMVTPDLLSRARAGDGEAFRELAESHRRELQVHCYRMLGSFQDAEDAVQETMLAAWQGIGGFAEERASLRTWLYKIATNRCINARRAATRRPAAAVAYRLPTLPPRLVP